MKKFLRSSLIAIIALSVMSFFQSCNNDSNESTKEILAQSILESVRRTNNDSIYNADNILARDSLINENVILANEALSHFAVHEDANLVPVAGIIFSIGGPICLVMLLLFFAYKDKKNRYKLIEKSLDNGFDPNSLLKLVDHKSNKNSIRPGLVCLALGFACLIGYIVLNLSTIICFGALIFIFLGIGLTIAYFVEKKNQKQPADNTENE